MQRDFHHGLLDVSSLVDSMAYPVPLVRFATSVFEHAAARRAALGFASARGRGLVLIYHRVGPLGPATHEVVPSLPSALFRRQLEALARLGDVVPLAQLLEPPRMGQRPRFAITFDDDHAGHVRHALPVLRSVGVQATFFLSGRALHGLPPYWWTLLEESIRARGLEFTRRALSLDGTSPGDLARALEGSPLAERLTELLPMSHEPPMAPGDIRALSEAGMTIGFHTLQHPVVSELTGRELESAMTAGRHELSVAAGAEVDLLAYPYGRANRRAAEAAERAAFRAAFVSGGHPITHESDPFLLGRWEPGPMPEGEFVAAVTLRLLRAPTSPRPVGPMPVG
jgi:peptidoglycan/xylan/chitin deacetylase (PgdA/CDA1 family)